MRVAKLTLEEQDKIRDLRDQIARCSESRTKYDDLLKHLTTRHFSVHNYALGVHKVSIDVHGQYLILE